MSGPVGEDLTMAEMDRADPMIAAFEWWTRARGKGDWGKLLTAHAVVEDLGTLMGDSLGHSYDWWRRAKVLCREKSLGLDNRPDPDRDDQPVQRCGSCLKVIYARARRLVRQSVPTTP